MKRTTRTRAGAKRSAAARRPSAGSGMGGKLLIMAALVAAVVFGVAIFFKVGRIEVQGNTIYASDKIIEASGLELGDNLLTVSRATVGGNVKAALPYVDQVSVGRVNNPTAGQTVTAVNQSALDAVLSLFSELDGTGILEHTASVNVEKEYDIVLQYDDRYEIDLGSTDRLDYKVQYLQAILKELSDFQAGTIDLTLSEANRAKFHPKA